MSERDYEVGYGRPPRQHRFKPGESGNRRGRPKGARAYKALVEEALSAKVTLTDRGKRRQVSVATAVLKRLIQKAVVDGDQRAIERVLSLVQQLDVEQPTPFAAFDDDDQAVLDAFLRRNQGRGA